MTHSRTHLSSPWSRCNKNGKCTYGFPQPLRATTSVNDEGRVELRRDTEEDRWISSHIPFLIDELECHIHVDLIASVWSYMYLYKYLHKGPDNTNYSIGSAGDNERVNEVADFQNGRYLSAGEAAWRILGFHVSQKQPGVERLLIHLPGKNYAQFPRQQDTSHTSDLLRYLARPLHPQFDDLTFEQYYAKYKLESYSNDQPLPPSSFLEQPHAGVRKKVTERPRGEKIVRIMSVSPTAGELFYLRAVLQHHHARSFQHLRTVRGTIYETWHETAKALGLFVTETEAHYALEEAVAALRTPAQLRFLYARVIMEGYPAVPLWDTFHDFLIRDHADRLSSEALGTDQTLRDLAALLHEGGRRLSDFGLPEPEFLSREVLIERDIFAGREDELQESSNQAFNSMTPEQKLFFHEIRDYLHSTAENPLDPFNRPIFIEGKPGRGKSFLLRATLDSLRADGLIVLIVGTTALAVQQYERGRTAHHTFRIPVTEVYLSYMSSSFVASNSENIVL